MKKKNSYRVSLPEWSTMVKAENEADALEIAGEYFETCRDTDPSFDDFVIKQLDNAVTEGKATRILKIIAEKIGKPRAFKGDIWYVLEAEIEKIIEE